MDQPQFDQLPLELAHRVDAACVRFERAFKTGQKPDIETFLADEEESARPVLLHELLSLEIELLQHNGETPSAEDYIERFPDAEKTVRAIFKDESVDEPARQGKPSKTFSSNQLNCPHCGDLVQIQREVEENDVVCPACGSSFKLDPDRTRGVVLHKNCRRSASSN